MALVIQIAAGIVLGLAVSTAVAIGAGMLLARKGIRDLANPELFLVPSYRNNPSDGDGPGDAA